VILLKTKKVKNKLFTSMLMAVWWRLSNLSWRLHGDRLNTVHDNKSLALYGELTATRSTSSQMFRHALTVSSCLSVCLSVATSLLAY